MVRVTELPDKISDVLLEVGADGGPALAPTGAVELPQRSLIGIAEVVSIVVARDVKNMLPNHVCRVIVNLLDLVEARMGLPHSVELLVVAFEAS